MSLISQHQRRFSVWLCLVFAGLLGISSYSQVQLTQQALEQNAYSVVNSLFTQHQVLAASTPDQEPALVTILGVTTALSDNNGHALAHNAQALVDRWLPLAKGNHSGPFPKIHYRDGLAVAFGPRTPLIDGPWLWIEWDTTSDQQRLQAKRLRLLAIEALTAILLLGFLLWLHHLWLLETANSSNWWEKLLSAGAIFGLWRQEKQRLQDDLQMLETACGLAQVGGWELDVATRDFNLSREGWRINELDPSEKSKLVKGIELYPPEYRVQIQAALDAAIADGKPWDLELQRFTLKGRLIWVRTQGLALLKDGKPYKLVGAIQDITARKSVEVSLKNSEARYQSVISALNEGVVIHAPDSSVIDCNSAAEKILGLTCDQLRGLTPMDPRWQSIHEDGSPFPGETHPGSVALATGQPQHNVIVGVRKGDDSLIWMVVNAAPLFANGDSTPIGAVSSFIDITSRKTNQQKLQKTAERLELVLRGSNDAPWDWDLVNHELYHSPRWWTMLGYDPQHMEAKADYWQSFVKPADRSRVKQMLKQAQSSGGDTFEIEFELQHKDGHYLPILARGFVLRDKAGNAIRMSGTNTDLSERKQAAREVLASQRFVATIAHSMPGMVAHWDKDLRCDFANRAYLDWYGKTHEEVIGASAPKIIGEELYRQNMPIMEMALTGVPQRFHRQVCRPNGELVDIWSQYIPDMEGDKIVGMFVLVSDITVLKNTERALQASLNDKVALLKEVHHRVKNNLQVINSLLRLESGRASESTRGVLLDMQSRIRAMSLLHESLQRDGIYAAIDLASYLRQLANQTFRLMTAANNSIELVLELESILLDMDQAMPCGLLVSELISNAFKHAFPNALEGKVIIQLTETTAGVELTVADTGIGLPPDFERRRRESLGLQLVSDLSAQLGGNLEVGPDSRFHLTFTRKPVTGVNLENAGADNAKL